MEITTTKLTAMTINGERTVYHSVFINGHSIGTILERIQNGVTDFRAIGSMIFGRANSYTPNREVAIERVVRAANKPCRKG